MEPTTQSQTLILTLIHLLPTLTTRPTTKQTTKPTIRLIIRLETIATIITRLKMVLNGMPLGILIRFPITGLIIAILAAPSVIQTRNAANAILLPQQMAQIVCAIFLRAMILLLSKKIRTRLLSLA